ncbi:MAG: RNA polymerase sigma factor [Thermoanaerobaculaceae bacterium]|nr:RNA polymerase sigma factor [Thermoanaerobaculaceae bacterium]
MAMEAGEAAAAEALEVERAKAGDEAALEALVRRHEGDTYRLCRRMLGDPEEAMEATQDTFLRVVRALPAFRGEASFRTWVLGIAINVCRTRLTSRAWRDRQRWVSLSPAEAERSEEVVPEPSDPRPDPERRAWAAELRRALGTALGKLTREHREVLLLHEMTQLDYEELARVLGVRVGTVKSRMARARAALRVALREVWP